MIDRILARRLTQSAVISKNGRVTRNYGMAAPRKSEEGQITVMVIGFVLLALLLMTVIAAASSTYLAHKKLLSLADSAALAGADSFSLSGANAQATPGTLLSGPAVNGAVQDYLANAPSSDALSAITVMDGTGTVDGHSAQVNLRAKAHPIIINLFVPEGITISASSTARAQLRQ